MWILSLLFIGVCASNEKELLLNWLQDGATCGDTKCDFGLKYEDLCIGVPNVTFPNENNNYQKIVCQNDANGVGSYKLFLGRNKITSIEQLPSLPGLITLDLSSNELIALPENVFDNLTRLTTLNLVGNELTELPDHIFDNLSQLEKLYLSNNLLKTLPPNVFDNLSQLTELELYNNQLIELPDHIFDKLTQLTELDLETNSVTSLPPNVFQNLSELKILWLNNNQLSSLPDNVFASLLKLVYLNLLDNKLCGEYSLNNLENIKVNKNLNCEFFKGKITCLSCYKYKYNNTNYTLLQNLQEDLNVEHEYITTYTNTSEFEITLNTAKCNQKYMAFEQMIGNSILNLKTSTEVQSCEPCPSLTQYNFSSNSCDNVDLLISLTISNLFKTTLTKLCNK